MLYLEPILEVTYNVTVADNETTVSDSVLCGIKSDNVTENEILTWKNKVLFVNIKDD